MISGTLTLVNSTLNLTFAGAPAFLAPTKFLLLNNDSADTISGAFGIWTNAIGYAVTIDYAFNGPDSLGRIGDGNDLAVTVSSLASVPEPSTIIVWGLVLMCMACGAKSFRKLAA